ncbi:MAG TPA: hypothetical protein VGX23_11780 [Actinocrinis sp.]|nr:hypothetical protein [Actinocrinis sp.]
MTEPEKAWFRVTPDGVTLARMWQMASKNAGEVRPHTFAVPQEESLQVFVVQLRESFWLSQENFAKLVVKTGKQFGVPNSCSKRMIQSWENGKYKIASPPYQQVLALLAGQMRFHIDDDGVVRAVPVRGAADAVVLRGPEGLRELGATLSALAQDLEEESGSGQGVLREPEVVGCGGV